MAKRKRETGTAATQEPPEASGPLDGSGVAGEAPEGVVRAPAVLVGPRESGSPGTVRLDSGEVLAPQSSPWLFVPLLFDFFDSGGSLAFAGVVYGDHPLAGRACQITWEGEQLEVGRQFVMGTQRRREIGEVLPLWSQIWEMRSALLPVCGALLRWVLTFRPASPGVIGIAGGVEEVRLYQEAHQRLSTAYDSGRLALRATDVPTEPLLHVIE